MLGYLTLIGREGEHPEDCRSSARLLVIGPRGCFASSPVRSPAVVQADHKRQRIIGRPGQDGSGERWLVQH
jgi:hypothetical protein